MTDSAPKQEPPYGLRMPPDLKARVKAAAEANNRSMNAEIVATLEKEYPEPELTDEQQRLMRGEELLKLASEAIDLFSDHQPKSASDIRDAHRKWASIMAEFYELFPKIRPEGFDPNPSS